MKIRTLSLIITMVLLVLSFSGCSFNFKAPDNLMNPPKIAGGYQDLQDAFEAVAGVNVDLKTPANGERKSAFIIDDFDSDGNEDAMVFYSPRDEKETVNIAVFSKTNAEWKYIKTINGIGTSVDMVVLEDMNGDKVKEVIVGWNLYSLNKQLCVYEPIATDSSNYFFEVGSYQYNLFSMIDVDSDLNKELFFVNLDTTKVIQSAYAQVIKLSQDGKKLETVGKTSIDGNVSGYSKINVSFEDEQNVIMVDAFKNEHDMITEVLVWNDSTKKLTAPLLDAQTQTNSLTWRNNRIPVSDINNDQRIEIPVGVAIAGSSKVVAGELQDEKIHFIRWSNLNGSKLKAQRYNIYNYNEGYSLEIPSGWVGKITLNSLDSQWYFYRWNEAASEKMGNLLFSLVSHSKDTSSIDGYNSLTEFNGKAYEYSITAEGKKFGVTGEILEDSFSIITEDQGGIQK